MSVDLVTFELLGRLLREKEQLRALLVDAAHVLERDWHVSPCLRQQLAANIRKALDETAT